MRKEFKKFFKEDIINILNEIDKTIITNSFERFAFIKYLHSIIVDCDGESAYFFDIEKKIDYRQNYLNVERCLQLYKTKMDKLWLNSSSNTFSYFLQNFDLKIIFNSCIPITRNTTKI